MFSFNFKEKYLLEDDVALLRPLELNDYENLIHYSLNETDLWKYSLAQPIGEGGLKEYLKTAIAAIDKETEYPFIVFDKRSKCYAGSTRFYDVQLPSKSLQLGYTWYGKQFQGTGLNKHCKFLLLEFAFERMGMERVEFRADNDNARSIAAMKSIGCTVDGVLRSNSVKPDGRRRDSIVLSILKSEWEKDVKHKLQSKVNGD